MKDAATPILKVRTLWLQQNDKAAVIKGHPTRNQEADRGLKLGLRLESTCELLAVPGTRNPDELTPQDTASALLSMAILHVLATISFHLAPAMVIRSAGGWVSGRADVWMNG